MGVGFGDGLRQARAGAGLDDPALQLGVQPHRVDQHLVGGELVDVVLDPGDDRVGGLHVAGILESLALGCREHDVDRLLADWVGLVGELLLDHLRGDRRRHAGDRELVVESLLECAGCTADDAEDQRPGDDDRPFMQVGPPAEVEQDLRHRSTSPITRVGSRAHGRRTRRGTRAPPTQDTCPGVPGGQQTKQLPQYLLLETRRQTRAATRSRARFRSIVRAEPICLTTSRRPRRPVVKHKQPATSLPPRARRQSGADNPTGRTSDVPHEHPPNGCPPGSRARQIETPTDAQPAHTKKPPPVHIARTAVSLAVAEGFEPSVGDYPTLAFEASTFGRSDTPPRKNLSETTPAGQIARSD